MNHYTPPCGGEGRSTFAYDAQELTAACEAAVELLRCTADEPFQPTIEMVALRLDCSLFVTSLARMWAKFVADLQVRAYEVGLVGFECDVLLEAALLLETPPS